MIGEGLERDLMPIERSSLASSVCVETAGAVSAGEDCQRVGAVCWRPNPMHEEAQCQPCLITRLRSSRGPGSVLPGATEHGRCRGSDRVVRTRGRLAFPVGTVTVGADQMRRVYSDLFAAWPQFGGQIRPPVRHGDLATT